MLTMLLADSTTAVDTFKTVIQTQGMFDGLLDGVTGSLGVIIPVMVGFLAVRKGISFVFGNLRRA